MAMNSFNEANVNRAANGQFANKPGANTPAPEADLFSERPEPTTLRDGTREWHLPNGQLHRDDGPAIEYADGSKAWYRNDELHREDGPAIEYSDGTGEWFWHNTHVMPEHIEKLKAAPSQPQRHNATVKTLRESPITGVKTKTVDEKTWVAVDKWFEDQGKYYGDEVRGFRRNSKGQLTFKTGGGYDTIDMDLLGGDGSGRARAAFSKATGIYF